MPINPEALIERLNPITRAVLEAAVGLSRRRSNAEVDIEHYLASLVETKDSDFSVIAAHAGINRSRLARDLELALDRLPSGWTKKIAPSQPLMRMLTEAWTIASLQHAASSIRTGTTVLALVSDYQLSRIASEFSHELGKVNADELRRDYDAIVSSSVEQPAQTIQPAIGACAPAPADSCLAQFSTDLTELARQGKLDPVVGRDQEVGRVIDILLRRRQNNPILTGEAGVGKTAIVEGFAMRIASGDVHPSLKTASVHALDLTRLQAGASARGEFEGRLKRLIDEVSSSAKPRILFIDEAHTIIGAGGAAGTGDAANILKPALARGELRTIAATTWSEYRKHFEADSALARRFQVVKIDEPSADTCIAMVRGVASSLERHHDVTIRHDAIEAAVRLSSRYLPDRQLPDKAISALDTACARVALQHSGVPQGLIALRGRIGELRQHQSFVRREQVLGAGMDTELTAIERELAQGEGELATLSSRSEQEHQLVHQIRHAYAELQTVPIARERADQLRGEYREQIASLRQLQGSRPLVMPFVDANVVAAVISGWTGVPVGNIMTEQASAVLDLRRRLSTRVIGQDSALETICKRIATSRAGITRGDAPIGVFLLVGPTGVGKTETAVALAEEFYEGRQSLISINMTGFRQSHTVSLLKGSPPGYVGYKEGGVLTEAVRRRPYSVILLDEVEKAHPAVRRLFMQVFDEGRIEDSEGREIDFRNTVLLLTTNAGSELVTGDSADGDAPPLRQRLRRIFGPELMGRLTVVPYPALSDETLHAIVSLKLESAIGRVREVHGINIAYDEAVSREILDRCREVDSGARSVDAILTNTLLPGISFHVLRAAVEGRSLRDIRISTGPMGFEYREDGVDAAAPVEHRPAKRRRRKAAESHAPLPV